MSRTAKKTGWARAAAWSRTRCRRPLPTGGEGMSILMDNRAAAGPSLEPAGRGALGATAALLWAAACPFPDPERVRRACEGEIDAHLLVAAAIEQGVGPLVWQGVSLSGCQEQLGDAAQILRANAAMWHAKAHFVAGGVAQAVGPPPRRRGPPARPPGGA